MGGNNIIQPKSIFVDPFGKKSSRDRVPNSWKTEIIGKQRSYCAGKNCAKLHHTTRKQKVDIYTHFDHIRPIAMNGKNTKSNIQALCPKCHMEKTRKDRERIKKWKQQYGNRAPYKF